MRTSSVVLLLALSMSCCLQARGQDDPGCGPANIKFDVSTQKTPQGMSAVQPGKALVYFLQDDLNYNSIPRPTTRFGIDGNWVGATHANSYFYISVDPGDHHLCASWQSFVGFGTNRSMAAAHFTTEAGKTYYFRAQDITKMDHSGGNHDIESVRLAEIVLEPLDPDEAQLLIHSFSLSSSHPRK